LRTFALPRMRNLRNTKARFQRPADFSISRYLSDAFGVFKGRAKYRVRIRFDAFAARLVAEREWHSGQKIRHLADGEIELAMDLGSLEEIERWVLSWGLHATVLEPAALVSRMRETAEELARVYAK